MAVSAATPLRLLRLPIANPKFAIPTTLFPPSSSFCRPISFSRVPPITPIKTPTLASSSPPPSSLQPLEELPPKLQDIVRLFQSVSDPKAKYEQLLFYGKNLRPLGAQFKTRENKVEGCVSQVWVRAYLEEEDDGKNVVFEADSDSVLTKGLAALLVQGLSGRPVEEIVRVSPDFVVLLGLQQSLTPSRNNGFLNMLRLMQRKAVELVVEAERGNGSGSGLAMEERGGGEVREVDEVEGVGDGEGGGLEARESGNGVENGGLGEGEVEVIGKGGSLEARESGERVENGGLGRRGTRIKEVLEGELRPVELEVEDVSYQHAGHAGVRGSGDGETHFNVKVVSGEFEGKSLVKRHRLIYGLLEEELQTGLHALSIVAKTPAEV